MNLDNREKMACHSVGTKGIILLEHYEGWIMKATEV